jgi:hypothetical protein
LTLILQVASETKQNNTLNLVPHVRVQLLNCAINNGTPLTIDQRQCVSICLVRLETYYALE